MQLDLDAAHPDYWRRIPAILRPLVAQHPGVLRRVALHSEPGDRSLGFADGSIIKLNSYWFRKPVSVLRQAAQDGYGIGPVGVASWHADMDEPEHVLIHEFGHCLRHKIGRAALDFAKEQHEAALREPRLAPTGYSLLNPEEWWGDAFAALHCAGPRIKQNTQIRALNKFLHDG